MFIILAIAVVGGVGYYIFRGSGKDSASDLAVTVGDPVTEQTAVEQELLAELDELRRVRLDESLFTGAPFRSLVDFSEPIAEQPVGRANPFAPVGGASSQ